MSKPSFYNLAWRWHFYAGLFVIPFMILLSLTGIVYLFKPQLDQLMYPELLSVQPAGTPLSADQQLARLQQALPQAEVSQYLPPATAERSAARSSSPSSTDARPTCSSTPTAARCSASRTRRTTCRLSPAPCTANC